MDNIQRDDSVSGDLEGTVDTHEEDVEEITTEDVDLHIRVDELAEPHADAA